MIGLGVKQMVAIATKKIAKYVDEQNGKKVYFTVAEINNFLNDTKDCNHQLTIDKLNNGEYLITLTNKVNLEH